MAACTTLGPMPATTGVSAVPNDRPSVDGEFGAVPAFYLSQSAKNEAKGVPITQLSVITELDRFIHAPGVVFGARLYGQSGDTPGEPYLGYRTKLGDRLSLGGGLYGTSKRSTNKLAEYHATRLGAELAADAALWAPSDWFALHGQLALSGTRILASGNYCVDAMGIAKDCNEVDTTMNMRATGKTVGFYPAAAGTLAVDFLREGRRRLRGIRLALPVAVGAMPLVKDGDKTGTGMYWSFGLTLSLTVSLADQPDDPLSNDED